MNLYITDLDKTFLHSDLSVSEYSKEIWNEALKQGHIISVATARSLKKSLDFLQGLEFKAPLILLDGAMVAMADGKVVSLHALEYALSQEIIEYGRKLHSIEPFIVGIDKEGEMERFLYPATLNIYQQQLISSYKNDNRLRAITAIEPLKQNLKIVYMGSKEEMCFFEEELIKRFGSSIHIKNAPDVYFDCYFLTVLHPLGDKAHALDDVMEYMDIEKEKLVTFGDNHNDIEMFKKAHKGVAVANAVEELKTIADVVLPHSNDEDGVAHYIKGCL